MKNEVVRKISKLIQGIVPVNKPPVSSAELPIVQRWLPVRNIFFGLIHRYDGSLVGVIRVEPAAFGLLSPGEKNRRIAGLHEAIQTLTGAAQICAIPRPINLDAYITDLENRILEAEGSSKTMLRGYVQYVRSLVASAQAMERRFYVLMTEDGKKKGAREQLQQRMGEFVSALGRAELRAHICSDQEVLDLLFCFFHPAQAALERPTWPVSAPIYVMQREGMYYGLN